MHTAIGQDIEVALHFLVQDEVVAIPTETVYGLAANALSAQAVAKIYTVKNRPQFNPLILHVASRAELEKYVAHIPAKIARLLDAFSPGPLTVLLPKSDRVPDLITAGSSKVAIRIPQHPLTLGLLQCLDFPLAAPSANISGTVSPTTAEHVYQQLSGKIPYILDGKAALVGLESTIVGYDAIQDILCVHRLGGLAIEAIEAELGEKIRIDIHHDRPETPGQLKSHYATRTPLKVGNIARLLHDKNPSEGVVIHYHTAESLPVKKQFILTENNTAIEAAQNLFRILREADACQAEFILCEWAPNEGLGLAINDRLRRASFVEE